MELQLEPKNNLLSRVYNHSEVIIVAILVAIYLFLSNYYYWSATFIYGGGIAALPTSGGSDPYYNFVVILHIINQHSQLVFDPTLNYPLGTVNPRNPFFHWFIVLVAEILSPIYGAQQAAFYAFEEFNAVFGALLIIPVYLITREIFGKNAAGVGAFMYTLMPGNLSAGILSGGRMHTPELIFAFFAIYFFAKAIKLSQKTRIIDNLRDFRTYHIKILNFFNNNRMASIYALLAGASLGGLMLAWQGYAYIEAILLIYVAIQLIANLILKKPTGYITFYTALFIGLGFLMGAYYYLAIGEGPGWYNAEVLVGVVIVVFGAVIGIIGRRPWVLIIPVLIIAAVGMLAGMAHFSPALLQRLLSGEGYFIKTRVYDTIAEAAAPQLGQYIGGFGVAQFILGMSGLAYVVYLFLKEKTDELLFILVFSLVSIYMSFAAARFNITAAPAYAVLGAGMLMFFAKVSKIDEIRKKKPSTSASPIKAIKGNIKWLQAAFVIFIAVLMIIPSATFMVSASVPYGSPAQSQVESQIGSTVPSFLSTNNTTSFVGGLSSAVTNGSTPLSLSLAWLSTQDSNLPIADKPAYVSWWDYGFQERYQGQHPTVADDFQQGIPTVGQALLAQNQSRLVSIFAARILQGNYKNGNFSPNVTASLIHYLGYKEYLNISEASKNPNAFKDTVLANPSIYGSYISQIDSQNVYVAYIKGQLAGSYSMDTIVNLYQAISQETGYSIKYMEIPTDNSVVTLFPTSASNTGIFYAPAYLTYAPSYATSGGGVIPVEYYNIYANTDNGTFSLQNLPKGVVPTSESISYTSAFYNTSIYRFVLGYPPSAVGQTYGIPGIDYGTNQYTAMPAWNMSNFELVYENIPFNPYTDYAAHPSAWTTIPLQQAYTYQKAGIGTVELPPPVSTIMAISDPIVAYYPGAIVHGRVTMPNGDPVPGVHVTILDQYGIPHEVVSTNSEGYYNITALPGNDTIYFSQGSLNSEYLIGSNPIGSTSLFISSNQANRIPTSFNSTTGLPNYYITANKVLSSTSAKGTVSYSLQETPNPQVITGTSPVNTTKVNDGTLVLSNATYGLSYNVSVVNGQFLKNDIAPLSYNVTLIADGHTFSNFSQLNVTLQSSTVSSNLEVSLDTIFANVALDSHAIPGISISAKGNNGFVFKSQPSNANGTAMAWVTPGNYSVAISGNNISSSQQHVNFANWNSNLTVNLTPEASASVSITLEGGQGAANVTFYRNGLMNRQYAATGSGSDYSADLPYGVYTLYVVRGNYSYMHTMVVNGSVSETASLSQSSNLVITSHVLNRTSYSGAYEVIQDNSYLQWQFTLNHTLQLQLPAGAYTVSGYGVYAGVSSAGFTQTNLLGTVNVNLSLNQFKLQNAVVYSNYVYGTYNSETAVTSGIVVLNYLGNPLFYNTLTQSGTTTLYYPDYAASSLSLQLVSAYFANASVSVSSQGGQITTTPRLEQSDVQLKTPVLSGSTQTLNLVSNDTSLNFTLSNGFGSVGAPIGFYYVGLSQSDSVLTAVPPYLVFTTTHHSQYNITAVQSGNLTIAGAETVSLYYGNGTLYTGSLSSVPAGNYQLYAFNSSRGVSISDVNVTTNSTLYPSYTSYYTLNLSNSLGIAEGNYTITFPNHSMVVGGSQIQLPSGKYLISYELTKSNSSGSFVFSGSSQINLGSDASLNVAVSVTEQLAHLSGEVTYNGAPLQYATVYVLDQSGKPVNTTHTNDIGQYSLDVSTGDHYLYVTSNSSQAAYLSSLYINGFADNVYDNVTAIGGYFVKLSVNLGSSIVNNDVNVSSDTASYTFNSSLGRVLLPVGQYSFTSYTSSSEMTANGTYISVSYSRSITESVTSNLNIALSLQKIAIHSFQVKLLSPESTLKLNQSANYTFKITNTGNMNETLSFASSSSAWKEVFNVTYLSLDPGQSANLTVNATLVGSVPYGSASVPFYANYTGGSSSQSLPIKVVKQPAYKISEQKLPYFEGTKMIVPVEVNNTGNSPINVSLYVNSSYLRSNGWYVNITVGNKTTNQVSLSFGQSEVANIVLSPATSKANFPLLFTLEGQNSTVGNQNVSVSMYTPSYAHITPYPSGSNVLSNYTGSPTESLIIGLILIAATVVGGLAISAYRGRKK